MCTERLDESSENARQYETRDWVYLFIYAVLIKKASRDLKSNFLDLDDVAASESVVQGSNPARV
jgi:hypothetical protein